MALIRHDDYVRDRAACDPEFARLRRQTASDLLDGNDEDRSIAIHILRDQLDLSEDEIQALQFARANALRDAAYFVRFGDYRLDACDYADAIAYYDRAIALAPDDADAYHSRGIAKDGQGDYAGAIADFDRAIALAPDDADAYHNRGVTKAEQGDYAGAIVDYDRVIALDPDNVAVYDDRAVAKAAQGDHAGAIADYGTYDDSGSLEHKETTV
ncbi:MAG: tetratricopeptide repeat protein [Dehalococcoidia bacterium]|nr:tetratricopeptide repeat protein [Dehalococcoidia bacterium]